MRSTSSRIVVFGAAAVLVLLGVFGTGLFLLRSAADGPPAPCTMAALLGVAAVLAPAAFLVVRAAAGRTLSRLAAGMEAVARGDLTVQVEVRATGEAGRLASAFNRMVASLRDRTVRVREGALQVAASGLELSRMARQVSDGARNQAAMLKEALAAVEELASIVEKEPRRAFGRAAGARKVSRSIENLNELTRGAALLADRLGRATEALPAQAGRLRALVGEYRTGAGQAPKPAAAPALTLVRPRAPAPAPRQPQGRTWKARISAFPRRNTPGADGAGTAGRPFPPPARMR